MISIFIMYSTDRQKQLDYTLSSLKQMELFDQCQKTLVVDGGPIYSIPEEWNAVIVPRINNEFCWSHMWDAGVETATNPIVLYLDSDRLLPPDFLRLIINKMKENAFLFTSKHFTMLDWLDWKDCDLLLSVDSDSFAQLLLEKPFVGKLSFEPRFAVPTHSPGKNVMSGSTAFLKSTYQRLHGVDPWYRGHGAFADTDFHMTAYSAGCDMIDLDLVELHCPHPKLVNHTPADVFTLGKMGLDNYVYYCHKWGIPKILAEALATEIGVPKPSKYVDEKLNELKRENG